MCFLKAEAANSVVRVSIFGGAGGAGLELGRHSSAVIATVLLKMQSPGLSPQTLLKYSELYEPLQAQLGNFCFTPTHSYASGMYLF